MAPLKALARTVFKCLPFGAQVRLARGNPSAAFYIRKRPARKIQIDYYLDRYRVEIDTSNDIQRRMLSGRYENDTLAVLKKMVQAGDTCLDIGANIGAITIALADLVGSNGRVEAFEPGPVFFTQLQHNLSMNESLKARVGLHQLGLSDKPGSLKWQESNVYTGTASMYAGVRDGARDTIELPVVRLDDFEPIRKLPKINFIKIDVDGLEREILYGARGLLTKHRPRLYFETTMWNDEMKAAAQDIEKYLRGLGYKVFKILNEAGQMAPTNFPNFSFNSVALHQDDRFQG
ncbi:MAG: FkbM family methyltransferase [Bdellovibrionia bacterium]